MEVMPVVYGLAAGITVLIGVLLMLAIGSRASPRVIGILNAVAGGVLAYLALEAGRFVAEYVESLATYETLLQFLVATAITTAAFGVTWWGLARIEASVKSSGGKLGPGAVALVAAVALGVHNVGEGFAIAAALLQGAVGLAALFTIGFAFHNMTEGFAIAGPFVGSRITPDVVRRLVALALIAGLPVIPGAAIYYLGVASEFLQAVLYSVATASLVFAMLHINLSAMSRLGGMTPSFWLSLLLGISLAFGTESIILFSGFAE